MRGGEEEKRKGGKEKGKREGRGIKGFGYEVLPKKFTRVHGQFC